MSLEDFVIAATSGRPARARRLLDAEPELADDRWARLVLGRGWAGEPNEVGGPRDWAPLHYVCQSCFPSLALARALLDGGADPNACCDNEHGPVSVLWAALPDPALLALLLERGADPNGEAHFGDALYHSVEAPDAACLRLLLEHGAEPRGSNALAHTLDYDHPEHLDLLFGAGADPNEGALLVHAVRRGRSLDVIRLLVDHGAELDRRGGEWSTPRKQHRTAHQNAVLRGREDVADLLADRGAVCDPVAGDREVALVAGGERPDVPLPAALDPDQQEVLILAALGGGQLELVVDLLGPGFFGHVGGGPPGTLLHHASWVGDPAVVGRLLALGADPLAAIASGTPMSWAAHGARHRGSGDHAAVAELLVAAGAPADPDWPWD